MPFRWNPREHLELGRYVLKWMLIAVPVGVFAALRQNSKTDHGTMFVVTLGHALPSYLSAAFMILLFSATLKLLPSGGWNGPKDLILPVLALSLGPAAVLARYVRSSMLETLREEYVTAAIAKGGPRRTVIVRHALRATLTPVLTIFGIDLGTLLGGAVLTEKTFSLPGLGKFAIDSIENNDLPRVLGVVMLGAFFIVLANLVVDVLYAVIDPRVRLS